MCAAVCLATDAGADRQRVSPGTGLQSAVVADSGANGICETAVRSDDIQATPVGQGAPFEAAVVCGQDRIASTAAAGDDRLLVAVGADCQNRNVDVVDTGPNGIAETAAAGDDEQDILPGSGAPHAPCVVTGGNGLADTGDPVGGDDVRYIFPGMAEANSVAVRCGANRTAETTANNVRVGDDVQLLPIGSACPSANTPVVDTGPNGLSETRAEGADLVLAVARPGTLTIRRRRGLASRRVKLIVSNVEFGGPLARSYTLLASDGSCPNGAILEVDADARMPGVQPTAVVARGRRLKASVVVGLAVEDVTSVERRVPFRCTVEVEAQALDTAPAADDATNPENNETAITLDVVDQNDLR